MGTRSQSWPRFVTARLVLFRSTNKPSKILVFLHPLTPQHGAVSFKLG